MRSSNDLMYKHFNLCYQADKQSWLTLTDRIAYKYLKTDHTTGANIKLWKLNMKIFATVTVPWEILILDKFARCFAYSSQSMTLAVIVFQVMWNTRWLFKMDRLYMTF